MNKPRSIADAVDKVARESAGKDWGLYAGLLDHWAEIVGPEYARITTPVKIAFPFQPNEARRKNGSLTVRLPKGLAMEFSFKAELIRSKVNAYMGYEAFARIALDPTAMAAMTAAEAAPADPQALTEIKEKAAEIENNELREALEKFGEAILAQKKNS